MELRNLRHFAAVADTLNFRVAAERLHLSQPALTRSIAALERELGVQLFVRDKRHVELTTHGTQLLERARTILSGADELAYTAHALSAASSRRLRVGIYGNGLAELTHPVLRTFCDRYPDTALEVRDADFAHGIDPLFSGQFDVALLRSPVHLPVLRTVPLFDEPMVVLVPEGDPRASTGAADVSDFFADPWVAHPPRIPAEWGASWLFVEQRGGTSATIGGYARNETEYFAAVAYRRLIALAPASAPRGTRHPGVRAVPLRTRHLLPAAVVHPATAFHPGAVAFAEIAASVVRRSLHLVPGAEAPSPAR
ncbi:DNA-binding transcriptional LysR family regulator [Amycolatopsis bartoniae]|uniref:LysR family transcriptional regulator n=1 Tax=Amycolatopsis bartoniae TaxID=941986 RepID=A0A8H9MBD0_9PSEU|nr:LysR family transcriptional regulator [Amycolatopsis bartoniae]MBB2938359.1 DNA-binding transcriptional LysR family regulator [Amycolatopsis bartoniae]TVS99235.1 LysR family transcriptional regulator [Amycolatopsis bartoniae]GHF34596.1 LysR family transcriptional regulator [Amycolatopsis bartoniae]